MQTRTRIIVVVVCIIVLAGVFAWFVYRPDVNKAAGEAGPAQVGLPAVKADGSPKSPEKHTGVLGGIAQRLKAPKVDKDAQREALARRAAVAVQAEEARRKREGPTPVSLPQYISLEGHRPAKDLTTGRYILEAFKMVGSDLFAQCEIDNEGRQRLIVNAGKNANGDPAVAFSSTGSMGQLLACITFRRNPAKPKSPASRAAVEEVDRVCARAALNGLSDFLKANKGCSDLRFEVDTCGGSGGGEWYLFKAFSVPDRIAESAYDSDGRLLNNLSLDKCTMQALRIVGNKALTLKSPGSKDDECLSLMTTRGDGGEVEVVIARETIPFERKVGTKFTREKLGRVVFSGDRVLVEPESLASEGAESVPVKVMLAALSDRMKAYRERYVESGGGPWDILLQMHRMFVEQPVTTEDGQIYNVMIEGGKGKVINQNGRLKVLEGSWR